MKTLLLLLIGTSICLATACQKSDLIETQTEIKSLSVQGTLISYFNKSVMPNTRIYIVQKSKPGQHSGSEVLLDSGYSSANGGISLNFQGNPDLFQYYLYAETLDTNFLPDETGTLLEFDKSTMIIQDFTLKEKCWARINFIYKSDASKLSFRVNDKDETHTLLASSFAPVTLLVNPLDAFKLHIKVYFPDGTIKESERDFSGQFYKPLTNINISY